MDRPTNVRSYGERFYAEMEPMQYEEPQHFWALLIYLGSVGEMFQEVKDLAGDIIIDGKQIPGWSVLVDLWRTPSKALGWLAQFVGVTLRDGLTDELQREWIHSTDGWKRGSPSAFAAAARAYLTGRRTVILRERFGSAYRILVITRTYETPDPNLVLSSILSQKPGGIVLEYHVTSGRTYLEVREENDDYADAKATYGDYETMRATREGVDIPVTTPLAPAETLAPSPTLAPGG